MLDAARPMNRERGTGGRGALVVAMSALLMAAPALAESTVPSAPGIRIGEGRLHPFLNLLAEYDSLTGYFLGGAPVGDLLFTPRAGLTFGLSTNSVDANLTGYGEYLIYSGLLSGGASTRLSRFQANVLLDTGFNKDGAVEVRFADAFTRNDRTQNAAVGVGVISLFNEARLAVPIHPGGRALEITPKVNFAVELFDPLLPGTIPGCADITCNPDLVRQMNYWNLNFGLNARWKFLPKTAITVDVQFDWRNYFVPSANRIGQVFRAQAGLVGLISPRITVTALVGYGGDFANRVNTVIANAEVGYIPTEQIKISAGYLRTVQPVPVYGTFGDDRGYLNGRVGLLGGRLTFTLGGAFDNFTYYTTGASVRSDQLVSGQLGASFDVVSWFAVTLGYNLSWRQSTSTSRGVNTPLRHDVVLMLSFHY